MDTSCVKVLEEERTGNAIIQNDREGDNCILLYGGANQKITREMADEVLGRFSAGDTYTGYFIASLLAQKTPEEAMERASRASAICVTRKGAAPSIPTPEEVESWVFG